MTHRWRALAADFGLAALLLAVCLGGTGPAGQHQQRSAPVTAYVLAAVAAASVAAWRYRPLWTFTVAGAATVVYIGLGYPYGPILLVLAVAGYGLAARRPARQALPVIAAVLVALMAAIGVGVVSGDRALPEILSVAGWLPIPAAAGVAVRVRGEARAQVRAEQARRAASEERLHLAQEVHDVVGHSLAVIAMQSGVALRVLDRDPAGARAALTAIRTSSQEALEGLRAEVAALRQVPGWAAAPRRPTTGLADLPGLAERMRAAGLPVTVDRAGSPDTLPPEVDHAAYRIVQESLTNVLRHAGPGATAQVRIGATGDAVLIEVSDTGHGPAEPAPPAAAPGGQAAPDLPGQALPGQGVAGMRERAEALGGTLAAGPRPGGGFAVRAELPRRSGPAGAAR